MLFPCHHGIPWGWHVLVCVCGGAGRGLHLPRAFGGCLGAGGETLGFITALVCHKPLAVGFVSVGWAE